MRKLAFHFCALFWASSIAFGQAFGPSDTLKFSTVAEAKSFTGWGRIKNGHPVELAGFATAGDGGGGTFVWNSSSAATDDGATVLDPTTPGNGRLLAIWENDEVNVRRFGAKGDNSNDDTAEIQAAIDAATAGQVVFLPAGDFLISATIDLPANITFRGTGYNSHLTGTMNAPFVKMSGVDNVTVESIRISSTANILNTGQYGVFMVNAKGSTVRGCYIDGMGYDGILPLYGCDDTLIIGNRVLNCQDDGINTGGSAAVPTYDTRIIGNYVEGSGSSGIHVSDSSHRTTVQGNTVNAPNGNGIDLYKSNDITIAGNTVNAPGGHGIACASGPIERVIIANNIIRDATDQGIRVLNATEVLIIGNDVIDPLLWGIVLSYSPQTQANVALIGNTVTGNPTNDMINLYQVSHVTFSDNYIDGGQDNQIEIQAGCDFVSMRGNRLFNAGNQAVRITGAKHIEFLNNEVFQPAVYGLVVTGTAIFDFDGKINGNTFTGAVNSPFTGTTSPLINLYRVRGVQIQENRFLGGLSDAIAITADCSEILIGGNEIEGMTGYGIDITGNTVDEVAIHGNRFQDCARGIYSNGTGLTDLAIVANVFQDMTAYAVALSTGSNVNSGALIANNQILGGCSSSGIFLSNYSGALITGNREKGITGTNAVQEASSSDNNIVTVNYFDAAISLSGGGSQSVSNY